MVSNNNENNDNNSNNADDNNIDQKRKKMVFILGDSILRNFNGYGLSKLVKHEFNVKSIFYPGATVSYLKDHIKRTAHVSKAGKISPHVGTNDFVTDKIPMQT